MLKINNGKCYIECTNQCVKLVNGVQYLNRPIYIYDESGNIEIGKYIAAYIVMFDNVLPFGEIKFTVGILDTSNNTLNCNYVLCEY